MAETAKKGKKKKGKTLNLVEFLTDGPNQASTGSLGPVFAARSTSSWADESEELNTDVDNRWPEESFGGMSSRKQHIDLSALPTAPVASLTIEVDYAKIPDKPPFTAFLGNLPYDVEKMDIMSFFKQVKITDVRLPQDSGGGRPKGFGYAEFADRESLVEALKMNNETLRGRKLRIDIAGQNQGGDGRDRNDREEVFDNPTGNWRDMCEDPPPRPTGRSDSNGDRFSRDGDRFSRDGDRFDRRDGDRGYYNDYDDQRRYDDSRPRNRYDGDRYGDRYDYSRPRDRNMYDRGRYGDRDRRDFDRGSMENGYGRNDRGYSDRGGYGDRYNDRGSRGYGGDRGYDRGGYGDRGGNRGYGDRYDRGDRGFDRGDRDRGDRYDRSDRDRGDYGDRGSGDGWERGSDRGFNRDRRDYGRGDGEMPRGQAGMSREPEVKERPKLQLKPRTVPVDDAPAAPATRSSIFGGAKPVDTTAKEREIEQKLEKMKVEVEKKKEDAPVERNFRARDRAHSGDGEFRSRKDSGRSSDGDKPASRGRRDSEKSVEKEATDNKDSSKEETTTKEPPQPTVNVWKQRMESQKTASEDKQPVTEEAENKPSSEKFPVKSTSETKPVSTGPPSGRGSAPRPFGRGGERGGIRGRGRGRGRGDQPGRPVESTGPAEMRNKEEKKERRERKPAEPKKVDEQPPVFHKQSKFSLLMDDEGDEEDNDEKTEQS